MASFLSMDHGIIMCYKKEKKVVIGNEIVTRPGKRIEFDGPEYHTDNPEEIKYIRSRSSFGHRIFEKGAVDDAIITGSNTPVKVYACSRKRCNFEAPSKADLKTHREDVHPRKTRR